MRHIILLAAVFVLGACQAAASRPTSTQPGSPWLVLVKQDPWRTVIGSDSPTFALYGDGKVIFHTEAGYKSVKLTPSEVDVLVARLKLNRLPVSSKSYSVVMATDQPTTTLMVFKGGKPLAFSVYGHLKHPEARRQLPMGLMSAYEALGAFEHPAARPWTPETIEVMIWPYEYAPQASIQWPEDWPGIDDPSTVKRGDEAYSLFLPSEHLPELEALLAERKDRGAVEIAGKKWAVSTRLPFPGEGSWMGRAGD